jgi:hypothetical protein
VTYQKQLGKFQHSRASRKKPRVSREQPEPETITTDGPCDGCEAGRLLARYGSEAAACICERVAKYGGRRDE